MRPVNLSSKIRWSYLLSASTMLLSACTSDDGSGDDGLQFGVGGAAAGWAGAGGGSQPIAGSAGVSGGGATSSPGASGGSASGPPSSGGAAPVGNAGAVGAPVSGTGGAAPGTGGMMNGDDAGSSPPSTRDVLLVGNSVAGSVSFVDARTLENLGSVNVIRDFDEVKRLIDADIVRAVSYPVVTQSQLLHHFEPKAGERFVDDVFVSPDGTVLYVSRSNLGDVAAFDLTKPDHPQLWRTFVESPKADHATISPDGSRLVVSATGTTRVADIIDAQTGKILGNFPTGAFPHQNDYSADGKYIYNSSIGDVRYNGISHANNMQKGDRWLVKVDAQTLEVVQRWVFEFGIRPNVVTADQKILYTQLSYLNGVVKYDLEQSREIARSEQPLSEFAMSTYATYEEYPHDSAHHGLALSVDGTTLCDCGTIDNTVALVSTESMEVQKMIDVGLVPYWATNSPDGRYCFVSLSGDDSVSVIDYNEKVEVAVVPVGKFPQRSRLGRVPAEVIDLLEPSPG